MNLQWKELIALASDEVETVLTRLPKPLRRQAQQLPITFERIPNAELQGEGVDADTLGLFVGPEFSDEGAIPMPPQIILFLQNLWNQAGQDEEIFRDEVETTLLHELGHYLGLNEDDLTDRGLE